MSGRGRPRGFDRESALRTAMRLFWEHGFEGTSLAQLTESMGITPPSLYAAFGSKEQLYREALNRYDELEGEATAAALSRPTATEVVEAMLRDNAAAYTDPASPRGCMVVLAASDGTERTEGLRETVRTLRESTERSLALRLARAKEDGDLPASCDSDALASYVVTILDGIALRAREGAEPPELDRIIDVALASWRSITSTPPMSGSRG